MSMMDQSDGALVLLALAGETKAFEALVKRYEGRVRTAAYWVTGNVYIAEDAAQEAFLAAWMKMDRLREPEKFGVWVQQIAKNCARNMTARFRSYISLEEAGGLPSKERMASHDQMLSRHDGRLSVLHDPAPGPEDLLLNDEEASLLRLSLERLSDRAKQTVYLHYYEDLDVTEISRKLGISEGTVKWQLHEGRKRMRKELCAMDERLNETFTQKVMKKVNELKLWDLKNSQKGFGPVYRETLAEAEALGESMQKHHALADILLRGYAWVPTEAGDAMLTRIKEEAVRGKNEAVMARVSAMENAKYKDKERLEYIKNVQIPYLEKNGFLQSLGEQWFKLGCLYQSEGNWDEAAAAFDKTLSLLKKDQLFHAYALSAREHLKDLLSGKFQMDCAQSWRLSFGAACLEKVGQEFCCMDFRYHSDGELKSVYQEATGILGNAFAWDGKMNRPHSAVGEIYKASDGMLLVLEAEDVTVSTPAGNFEGCQVWMSQGWDIVRTYLKEGVGIVRQETIREGLCVAMDLKACHVKGGEGLLPLAEGNDWEYEIAEAGSGDTAAGGNQESNDGEGSLWETSSGNRGECTEPDRPALECSVWLTVRYFDGKKALLTQNCRMHRFKYDENSWLDMIEKVKLDYWCYDKDGNQILRDVLPYARRAVVLAKTPVEKARAKISAAVMERILDTDPVFHPGTRTVGLWNFFQSSVTERVDGNLFLEGSYRWNFEWKTADGSAECGQLFHNDIYDILADCAGCLWSDNWVPGYQSTEHRSCCGISLESLLQCEEAGEVSCRAGTFQNCLRLTIVCKGFQGGLAYRGGRRIYTFAPGIGLIRVENEAYRPEASAVIFELTSFLGAGKEYMPVEDGMVRHYEALDLTGGYEAYAEYTYAADEQGRILVFENLAGVRKLQE